MKSDDVRIGAIIGLEDSGRGSVLVIEDREENDIVRVPCDKLRVMVELQQQFGNVITEGWGLVENGGHVGKLIAWQCDEDGDLAGFEPIEDLLSGARRKN